MYPVIFSDEALLFECNPDFNIHCKKGDACQKFCFLTTNESAADVTFIGPPELIVRREWKPKKTDERKGTVS